MSDEPLLLFAWRGCLFRIPEGVQPPKAGSLFFCRHLPVRAGQRVLELGSGLGLAAVYVGFVTVLYNFVAVIILTLPHRGSDGVEVRWAPMLKSIITNPLILSCSGGLLIGGLGLPLPTVLDRGLKLGGDLATPLALLVVGSSLDLGRVRSEFKPAFLVSLVKLFVYPGLIYAALYSLGLRDMFLETPVLLLASPTAVVSHVMAREMKGDDQLAGAIVIGSTLLSLFTLSAWLAFFHWMD